MSEWSLRDAGNPVVKGVIGPRKKRDVLVLGQRLRQIAL